MHSACHRCFQRYYHVNAHCSQTNWKLTKQIFHIYQDKWIYIPSDQTIISVLGVFFVCLMRKILKCDEGTQKHSIPRMLKSTRLSTVDAKLQQRETESKQVEATFTNTCCTRGILYGSHGKAYQWCAGALCWTEVINAVIARTWG